MLITFKKTLLIIALFLTVIVSSALTTVWLSARPVGAYSNVESRLDDLEYKVRNLEYYELDSLKRKVSDLEYKINDVENDVDYIRISCRCY